MTNVVIVSAGRTAVGSFNGSFANTPAHDLGAAVIEAVVARAGIDKAEVSETILGQVLTAGQGQNPARQAHIHAGPAQGIQRLVDQPGLRVGPAGRGAGRPAHATGRCGHRRRGWPGKHVAVAPCRASAGGPEDGRPQLHRHDDPDGLWDAFHGYHMGQTAENVASQWQISRDMQDEFALASQNKAEAAQKAGKFKDEIIPFTIKTRKGDVTVDADEYIRHGATLDSMQKLRPAFTKDGSVTAGNASGLNDGAAAVC
jgi:acetyl-CoA C-acetyltransferase